MGKTLTLEAIILRTHDVGEADRFCIIFTKQKGLLTARARGVRKLGSKIGGSLLPCSHVHLLVREGSSGYHIIDAQDAKIQSGDIDDFVKLQQGIEVLLSCIHDEEPLPEIFAVTLLFLETKQTLPYILNVLEYMGLLPDIDEGFFKNVSKNQKTYMRLALQKTWEDLPELSQEEKNMFSAICASLVSQIASKPLKAGSMVQAIT